MFKSLIIVGLIWGVCSVNFNLEQEPFCIWTTGGISYSFSYISSGVNQFLVSCVLSVNGRQLKRIQNSNEANFALQIPEGKLEICFSTTDTQPKTISFDFFRVSDPLREVIDKKDLKLVQSALREAALQMAQIGKNQHFHIERDEIHKIILEQSETRIKWAGIIKICFLLTSAFIQLWIMKGFFKQAQPYQPVSNM